MDTSGMTLGILIAIFLVAVSVYFAFSQLMTLQTLDARIASDQRRYLIAQCWRRLFGSVVLLLLAAMLVGSVFLDYDPLAAPEGGPEVDREAAKQTVRFLIFYFALMLVLVLLLLSLAVFDFWATARQSVRQQKQLFLEHQEMLAAELEEHRHRQAGKHFRICHHSAC